MSTDLTRARAYLDTKKREAALTDEQRADLDRRRKILGSLDDTYALNRHERGNTNAAYAGFVLMFAPQVWALMSGQVRWSALGMVLALGVLAVGGVRVVRGVRG